MIQLERNNFLICGNKLLGIVFNFFEMFLWLWNERMTISNLLTLLVDNCL